MIELVADFTDRGAILPDGRAIMTVKQAQTFIEKRFKALELAVTERVTVAINRYAELNYDLKQFQTQMAHWDKSISDFAQRLAAVEKKLGIGPFGDAYQRIDWRLTAQEHNAKKLRARAHARRRITGPEPLWQREAEAAAKTLRSELPELSGIPDLKRRFGVSYQRFITLIGQGKLKAVRKGGRVLIPRDSLIEYVRENGAPTPRRRSYGTSGIDAR